MLGGCGNSRASGYLAGRHRLLWSMTVHRLPARLLDLTSSPVEVLRSWSGPGVARRDERGHRDPNYDPAMTYVIAST
ncbi:hypothetical protein PSCLAVI8L_130307 [Pseudoclavibacter sp. 8L]|nr:hypothetical protein PSCLAVI8L_130307 [Pseudoclavibacter sp. 8L]